jgi:hypothetical protein
VTDVSTGVDRGAGATVTPVRVVRDVAVQPRDPSAVEGAARSILAGRQFRPPAANPVVRVLDWIGHQISRLLPSGGVGGPGLPSWAGSLILVAIVAVVAAVLWRSGAFRGGRGRVRRSPAVHEQVEDLDVAAGEWMRRAGEAEAGGDWEEGVRCRYRAALAVLAAAGAVAERVGRTAGSYRRRVAEAVPAAAGPFAEATDRFERAWYGRRAAGPGDRDAMAALHADIQRAVGGQAADSAPASAGTGSADRA